MDPIHPIVPHSPTPPPVAPAPPLQRVRREERPPEREPGHGRGRGGRGQQDGAPSSRAARVPDDAHAAEHGPGGHDDAGGSTHVDVIA
jgi:hypothetical protein